MLTTERHSRISRWMHKPWPPQIGFGFGGKDCDCCPAYPYYYGYAPYVIPWPQEVTCCPCEGVGLPDTLTLTLSSTCSCLNGFSCSVYRYRFPDGTGAACAGCNSTRFCSAWRSQQIGCTGGPCTITACYPNIAACGSKFFLDAQLQANCQTSSQSFTVILRIICWDGVSASVCPTCCSIAGGTGSISMGSPGNSCNPFVAAGTFNMGTSPLYCQLCSSCAAFPCNTGSAIPVTATFTL